MHRYLVERTFPPGSPPLVRTLVGSATPVFVDAHDVCGVTWLRSYITPNLGRSYCIVDGPSPEAVRLAARASGLPVDRISEVSLLERTADPCPSMPAQPCAREAN